MAVTTFAAIRRQTILTVEAIAPEREAGTRFRVARDDQEFRAWARDNHRACVRRFDIEDAWDYAPHEVSNADVVFERGRASLIVSYPRTPGRYGHANWRDLEDFVTADRVQLERTVGPYGQSSYLDGHHLFLPVGHTLEADGDAVFSTITFEVAFYRSV